MNAGFIKVRFERAQVRDPGHDATAGLILDVDRFRNMSITDVSRLFPYSEAAKMERLRRSPIFPTWDEAFSFSFDAEVGGDCGRCGATESEWKANPCMRCGAGV